MDIVEILAYNVRDLRHKKKWSQAELGHRCGLDAGHISKIETEKIISQIDTVQKIALALDVSVYCLLTDRSDS